MDLNAYSVKKDGKEIEFTAKEFEILKLLLQNSKKVYTKEQIYSLVWNDAYLGDENAVNVHISRLRTKIEDDPHNPGYIVTVWGIGYKAGAFTYTPAITYFQSHMEPFENLVNKAGDQCVRMENYLKEISPAPIYDSSKKRRNVKVKISFQDCTQVYSFSVNDLWVYSEYFTSPLQFIHFLKQRKMATL